MAVVSVAVVTPLHRTAEAVDDLVDRILAAVPDARLVLVDDACPDGSGEVAERRAAGDDRVVVLHHDRNRGQQVAIRTGLAATDGLPCVVLDADLQDPPEAIPALLDRLAVADVDAVFAGRRGAYERPGRRLGGMVHRLVLHLGLGLPVDAGGFVAMSPRCVAAVLATDGPPQLVATIGRSGLPTTSVPVRRRRRPAGSSSTTATARLRHAVAALDHVRRARRDALPTPSEDRP